MTQALPTPDHTVRLFKFLEEFTRLKAKPRRTSEQDEIHWLADLPQQAEIVNAARADGHASVGDVWIEVRKPKFAAAPALPELLTDWITGTLGDSAATPTIRSQRVIESQVLDDDLQPQRITDTLFLDQETEVLRAWEEYLKQWQTWAAEDRRTRPVQAAYSTLFAVHQKLSTAGETYELVLGLGYLVWRTPGGYDVKRHLLTARTTLSFDAVQGVIRVTAGGDGARTVLEQDMLDPTHRPNKAVQEHLSAELAENGEALWDQQTMHALLTTWANAAGERGEFQSQLAPPRGVAVRLDPVVSWAPALVLRKRIERSLPETYVQIGTQLKADPQTADGFERFTSTSNSPVVSIGGEEVGHHGGTDEIYFPLPANEEQRRIIRYLRSQPGVLVKGPPGTGKSHTIVNVVSHLLATRQRVLVTSHTARALSVLRDKFPAELAALCVTHLRGEEGSRATLERSVQELLQRSSFRVPEREVQQLRTLRAGLEQARQKEDRLLDTLREIRQAETSDLTLPGYRGKAQVIAAQLQAEEDRFSWLEDLVTVTPQGEVPLTDAEASRLLTLLRQIRPAEADELTQTVPELTKLVSPEEFTRFVQAEREATQQAEVLSAGRRHPHFSTLQAATAGDRARLTSALRALIGVVETGRRRPVAWAAPVVDAVLKGQPGVWNSLLALGREHLQALNARAGWLDETTLAGTEGRDLATLKADAQAVLAHLTGGGSWGWGPLRPAVIKSRLYLKDTVRVGGRMAESAEVLQELLDHLSLSQRLQQLEAAWSSVGFTAVGPLPLRLRQLQEAQDTLEELLGLGLVVQTARQVVQQIAGLPEPQWWVPDEVAALIPATLAVEAEEARRQSVQVIEVMQPGLEALAAQARAHPSLGALQRAITARDLKGYGLAYLQVQDVHQRRTQLSEQQRLLGRLNAWAPQLAGELLRTQGSEIWPERLAQLGDAWRWLHADARLSELANPDTEVLVREQLSDCRRMIRDTLGQLASALAWSSTLDALTQREQLGLTLWENAMRRLGKGTGKYAERHRKAAREALEQARSAIPAWIMPLHLVAESFTPSRGMFDVVIVDEASQAGPEALFLAYIGKQIIVVGDDMQIEPDAVGIDRDKVEALVQEYLYDFPARSVIGAADASLFGIAKVAYPPELTLREHFRCMPEIIAFSSRLSYPNQPLIPLRQFGAGRLPPVLARHVPDGYTEGGVGDRVNEPEAQAIVRQIKACMADPQYKDLTFGVISLLGSRQAERIATLLRAELPETEIERRRLVSGDAYSFQGDERDVMFLSMVTSPTEGRRETLKADAKFQARLNVAASRARDQLWLFHSVALSDLKPDDLRARLIAHCQHPDLGTSQPLDLAAIRDLTEEAQRPNRSSRTPPRPFDSWFELDVYLDVAGRGYRVLPQYEVNGYRIDLVVEGRQGKLAVECDGDYWHGPDAYAADLQRQQTLERAGWTFWRVRGSTYFRERHSALEDLWQTLDRQQVFPEGDERDLAPQVEVVPVEFEQKTGHMTAERAESELAPESLVPEPIAPAANPTLAQQNTSPAEIADRPTALEEPVYFTHTPPVKNSAMAPYRAWTPRGLPDPRVVQPDEVLQGLLEIIAAEGPMPCHRAYRLYSRAARLSRLSKDAQSALNRAVALGVRQHQLQQVDEWGRPGQVDKIVRIADAPGVVMRERGPRDFDEVPPRELALLMEELLNSGVHTPDEPLAPEPLFRTVLTAYGGVRLTESARQTLERAQVLREGAPTLL